MRAPSLCDKLGTGRAMPHDTERTLKGEVDLRRIPAKMNGFCALASYTTPTRMAVNVRPNTATRLSFRGLLERKK
jgi:hypothetical protein